MHSYKGTDKKPNEIHTNLHDPHEQPYSTVLTLTQQLTHVTTGQPS